MDRQKFVYGEHLRQYLHLSLPAAPPKAAAGHAVIVLIHGGYWKAKFNVDNTPICSLTPFLLDRDFAVADLEYRNREDEGGGWPGTNMDLVCALAKLKNIAETDGLPLDFNDVIFIGHSVGGCMVLWLDSQELAIRPSLIVSVAPVADLIEGYRLKLSDEGDAVEVFMKGRTPHTEEGLTEYKKASPAELLPFRTPLIIAIGYKDVAVPPSMGITYYQKVKESPDSAEVKLVEVAEADHRALVTASNPAWLAIYSAIESFRTLTKSK